MVVVGQRYLLKILSFLFYYLLLFLLRFLYLEFVGDPVIVVVVCGDGCCCGGDH